MTNSLAGSLVQLQGGPARLCPWARGSCEIAETHTHTDTHTGARPRAYAPNKQPPLSAQTLSLNKCDVTDQRIATLIHFSALFLKDMSKRNVLENWILALSKLMFQAPGRQMLSAWFGSLKKVRGQLMKSLVKAVYPQWETQEMNSDLRSQFQLSQRTERDVWAGPLKL